MLNIQPIYNLPLWVAYAITVLFLSLALEAGYRFGKIMQERWPDKSEASVGVMVGASLALLGFLLAFVTSIAIGIFNERRQLVISEANAIGTTYLRAGYLAEPIGAESRKFLREYLDLRLAALDPAQRIQAIVRSEEIHKELWVRAEQAAKDNPTPTVSLYISSLNEVIDLHTERINVELGYRVPPTILFGLYIVALLTMALVGLHSSYAEKRNLVSQVTMVMILSVAFLLIIDLDRSVEGMLKIPQRALIDLKQFLSTMP